MSLPRFEPGDDPGPSFLGLLDHLGLRPPAPETPVSLPHGTTCVALRSNEGVVIAGDRRATSGNLISHRTIEKVFQGDRYSAVAIAGAAGPAVQMVHLFQLQLEHYEKVEGSHLSLEGKANQLSQLLAAHLPAAMQGMAVVPIFAGWDLKRQRGRLFQYDVTGGRYEETEHIATGSGSLHASTVLKLGFRNDLDNSAAIDLAINSLLVAADEDSATGGPDLNRSIFPVVATVGASGYQRISDGELEGRCRALIEQLNSRRGGSPS